ncbi:MAG: MFS transporter [Rhizobiales bacterium 32-66-8]|nr:MAG: MFS transporter [Rhizobiales bacterium 32-66-8]
MVKAQAASQAPAPVTPRMMAAGAIGNLLEWYDFAAFGFLATIFAKNFFPASDPLVGLLSTFGVFAASFMMRPVGAVLFGHVGDRYGRVPALYASAGLMTLSTVTIGILPTYEMAGVLAPILLLSMRLLQGACVGGEYMMSAVFLAEHSPRRWRGLVTSFTTAGGNGGTLLGSGVAAVTASLLTPEQLADWGWRIPFLLGIGLGVFALMLRRSMDAAPPPPAAPAAHWPVVQAFREDWRNIARASAMTFLLGAVFYLCFVYLTTYMQQVDGLSASRALQFNTITLLVTLVLCVVFAALSDVVGRKAVIGLSFLGMLLFSWPLFLLLRSGVESQVFLGQLGFAVLIAMSGGPMPCTLVEMFPKDRRCTGVAVSWNLAIGIGGGTAPMIAVYLVDGLHDTMAPAIYLSVLAAIALVGLATVTERSRQPLDPAVPAPVPLARARVSRRRA